MKSLDWSILVDPSKGGLLGIEPTDQAVRVLVRTPLPRVLEPIKKHVHVSVHRNFFVSGKLLAVVEREAPSSLFVPRLGIGLHLIREPPGAWSLGLGLRLLVRLLWPVAAHPHVAHELQADAACGPLQTPGNLSRTSAFLTPTVDERVFFRSHALVKPFRSLYVVAHEERSLPRDVLK